MSSDGRLFSAVPLRQTVVDDSLRDGQSHTALVRCVLKTRSSYLCPNNDSECCSNQMAYYIMNRLCKKAFEVFIFDSKLSVFNWMFIKCPAILLLHCHCFGIG